MKYEYNNGLRLIWQKFFIIILISLFLINGIMAADRSPSVEKYNVIWKSLSIDPSGQMPIGNGDIAAGVYAIENDALYLLLSKNDALNFRGDLLKTGRVRIDFSPNPFLKGKSFKQTLDIYTGSITIEADGLNLLIWADMHKLHPGNAAELLCSN